jgi:hypothetical protein
LIAYLPVQFIYRSKFGYLFTRRIPSFDFIDHWYISFLTALREIIKHDTDKVIKVYGVPDFVLDALSLSQRTRIVLTGDPRQAKVCRFS